MTAHDRATTALLLAAGTGSRLRPLTKNAPKCLTEVGGLPILERLVHNLAEHGIERLVVVIGHLGDRIRDFLNHKAGDLRVEYITSSVYRTTNNIYSLWLARDHIQEPFLLVESDLVFDSSMLEDMLHPDKIAISRIRPWMNGTTVTLGPGRRIRAFHVGRGGENDSSRYKTVNICSLSTQTWSNVVARLNRYISDGRVGEYYEAVFAEMIADGALSFEGAFFDPDRWYEIDTIADLNEAARIFGRTCRAKFVPDVQRLQIAAGAPLTPVAARD
ncbi:MAG: phosphocholine cytidylyltransferase family protein [Alphaproteobacteria bacterium]|nr:MAG: phosphocholine cytidylyltransferase family protein [Alphaproteobacteria bacterium]